MKAIAKWMSVAFASCGLWAVSVPLQAMDLYGFDLPKQYPKAYSAYKALLPPQYQKISWMRMLNGTSGPLKDVEINGAPSVLFWMCEPHNCGGNELAVLARKDGKRATALFQSSNYTQGKKIFFGKPSEAETTLLNSALQ
jgi:hypothetical protein